ncbi:MAG: cation-translocating P-type ATPase [Bacillota bacterium]|nr:cation-translocating P-type ATPase [Bacillota bacterium]
MKFLSKGQNVFLTGTMILIALVFQYFHLSILADAFLWVSTFLAGSPIFKKAFRFVFLKVISIELLVTIAVIGAFFIGEFLEAAAVSFLFLLGSYLEARTLEKTRSSLKLLLDQAPLEARIIKNGEQQMIAAENVNLKDILLIQSGEKIPADGKVIEGDAFVNEAAITGEPLPVRKTADDKVFSGAILDNGYLKIEAEKVGEDTTFSKILQLVEEAQDTKAKSQRFIEKFAVYYTPAIILLSILVFIFTKDIRLSLTFLVISCPGALVISAPVSIVAGIGNGAKQGILIKGGEMTEKAAKLNVIAFDKTGTLTMGKPQVVAIQAIGLSQNELVEVTAKLESLSEHPLGRAIVADAEKKGILLDEDLKDFRVHKGMGVSATIHHANWIVGNRELLKVNQVEISKETEQYIQNEENKGRTAVMAACGQELKGIISISDQVRPEAAETVKQLIANGKKVIMLTGDNERTASFVANEIGIDEYYASLLPEQKVQKLKELQSKGFKVGMVGDGINDTPAIATADVGIAMGGAGTDAAMETADIVLMSDRMEKLPYSLNLARATTRNMKQNLFFACLVVALLLVGVLIKWVYLASGMMLHELSVLIVILNAIRLLKYNDHYRKGVQS